MSKCEKSSALMLVVAGPAGSGKTTLCSRLVNEFSPALQRIVTSTTRPPRAGEADGRDYYFFTSEAFQKGVREGAFYEHAKVHNFHYGTLKEEIRKKLNRGIDLLLNIDVQGAETYRHLAARDLLLGERLVTVFIKPKDLRQIRQRLLRRGLDRESEIEKRLKTAERELSSWRNFDHVFTSGSKETDYRSLRQIYLEEKSRCATRRENSSP